MSAPRTGRERGHLPDALLDAIADMIREGGIEAVGLREAARRAGVSPAAPAHHFRNRAGMLTAYAVRGYEEWVAEMQATLERVASRPPLERFLELGVAYVRFAIRRREYFEVMFRHELIDTSDPDLQRARDRAGAVLMEGTLGARSAGWATGSDPLHAALAAWSLVHGLAVLWLSNTLADRLAGADVDELARRTIEVLLRTNGAPQTV